jgi:death-on-curing protein
MRRIEPRWLSRVAVDAIHLEQLREHGGLPGVRDDHALESALARPQQQRHYDEQADVALLAAAYGFGLVQSHPYRDGNKRAGLLALATFLELNGQELTASDAEVVSEILALASGHVSENELADWIRQHTTARPKAGRTHSNASKTPSSSRHTRRRQTRRQPD